MNPPRKPAAFRIEPMAAAVPEKPAAEPAKAAGPRPAVRAPRTAPAAEAVVVPAAQDYFSDLAPADADPPPLSLPRRRVGLGSILASALGVLASLALGLWADSLIRGLFERLPWLGWFAAAVAAVAALALLAILAREAWALSRLASIGKLRHQAADAFARDDAKAARHVVAELSALVSAMPQTAAGRRVLAATQGEIVDGADLIRLAETEILRPLDESAKALILDAAKRVSIVTTVSPRALIDLGYVLFEAGRLIRRIARLYGVRPGTLGFLRLARDVLAHLAVTGAIAAGDDVVHQLVGQGLAARLSAKLGEGLVNGMMTVRIGIAAMDVARPLPFAAVRRPRVGDFLSVLAAFARRKGGSAGADP